MRRMLRTESRYLRITKGTGTARHITANQHTTITTTDDEALMKCDFAKNRYWTIDSYDSVSGRSLGGLRVTSNAFGPPPMTDMYQAPLRYNETDYTEDDTILVNWWLQRNVWVLNEAMDTNSGALIARPTTANCKFGYTARRCIATAKNEPALCVNIQSVAEKDACYRGAS